MKRVLFTAVLVISRRSVARKILTVEQLQKARSVVSVGNLKSLFR